AAGRPSEAPQCVAAALAGGRRAVAQEVGQAVPAEQVRAAVNAVIHAHVVLVRVERLDAVGDVVVAGAAVGAGRVWHVYQLEDVLRRGRQPVRRDDDARELGPVVRRGAAGRVVDV